MNKIQVRPSQKHHHGKVLFKLMRPHIFHRIDIDHGVNGIEFATKLGQISTDS